MSKKIYSLLSGVMIISCAFVLMFLFKKINIISLIIMSSGVGVIFLGFKNPRNLK